MIDGWSPGLVGPTLFGWVTVLLYFAAATLCWRNGRAAAMPTRSGPAAFFRARSQRRVWSALAGALLVLGINKQVDLQTLITALGRHAALEQGWYGARRGFQRELIALVLLIAGAGGALLAVLARRAGGWAVVAVVNTAALAGFVAVRATSLHGIDAALGRGWGPITVNRCVEIGAIALDMVAALAARRRLRV